MSPKTSVTLAALPVTNYGSAITRAIEWLGHRYLLARPVNAPQLRNRENSLSPQTFDIGSCKTAPLDGLSK